jgi:homoserine O-acetyltransferase
MGGMAVLEWPLCSPQGYIRHVVPLATSARHSAWCISWGEAQRQSIYSDPLYQDGFYYIESGKQPAAGLAAARMSALLTYRSRDSFERRFGRKPQLGRGERGAETPPLESPKSQADEALAAHNDGHKGAKSRGTQPPSPTSPDGHQPPSVTQQILREALQSPSLDISPLQKPQVFSAQSYLRYQGDKFTARFDANCYIHITRKMDTHDIARGRRRCAGGEPGVVEENESQALARVLSTLPPRALVISIETDGLFTTTEQRELAAHIPQAELVVIPSEDGHDGFLLEFERINEVVSKFLRREYPEMYEGVEEDQTELEIGDAFEVKKNSVFGEAEVDITSW